MFDNAEAIFRPSEYTAALIQTLRAAARFVRGARVLEIGCGSGVVLAAAGALGAASLDGVDIEEAAVASSAKLLRESGCAARARLHQGDMWSPVGGRRFDVIAANLPHFPMRAEERLGRLASWSSGGPDGRNLLDRFFDGLGAHLAEGGRCVLTHNAFVDLDRSRRMVGERGLALRIAARTLVYIPREKWELMPRDILIVEEGRTIHRYGPHVFGEMCIVEIAAADTFG